MRDLIHKLLDEFLGAWRFRWYALIIAWVGCLCGWAAVLALPETFQAQARVFVDTRTTLSEVTQGIAVDTNVDAQIQRVRQALLGGPVLEKVARESGLLPANKTPQQVQGLLNSLRDRIVITASSSRETPTASTYVVSYEDRSRESSLRLVDHLVNTFVENSKGGNRAGSEQAQKFLTAQIADYENRLSVAEERLADFKKKNFGLMPGAQGDYFTRLQTETDALSKAEAALAVAERRQEELQRQMRGEQPVLSTPAATTVRAAAPGSAAPNPAAANNDTSARVRETQARLDELLLRFTDKHPDVIALRQTLAELKQREQSEIDAVRRGDPGAAAKLGLASNPVFQSIQLQYNQSQLDVTGLRAELTDRRTKIAQLRTLLNTAPEIEADLSRLNRDYDVTRAQYQSLVERLGRAHLAEDADVTGAVHFEIIDPPSANFTPVAPNRPRLIMVVLLGGLALGGAFAYLLHQLKPVFSSARSLTERTGLPVLGAVSMTWLERYKAQERRSAMVYVAATAMLVIVFCVVFVTQNAATALVHRVFT